MISRYWNRYGEGLIEGGEVKAKSLIFHPVFLKVVDEAPKYKAMSRSSEAEGGRCRCNPAMQIFVGSTA